MKKFKVADFWINVSLILGFIIFGLATRDERFGYGYFVVGGWQVISMAAHWVNKWFTGESRQRINYHRFVLALSAVILLFIILGQFAGFLFAPLLIILWLMLFIAPLLAIFYAAMCYQETFIRMKRPMYLLK